MMQPQQILTKYYSQLINHKLSLIILMSFAVSSLVFGVRSFGGLTDWELRLYDRFLQWQPAEPPDPRILIVGIDEQDLTSRGKSDLVLSQLINKLDRYQPQAIGLDSLRDIPQEPGNIELTSDFQANNKIITICSNADRDSVAPPPNVPKSRVGFADFVIDGRDKTVRRNLLSLTPNIDSKCHAGQSFGLLLAINYLTTQGIKIPDRSNPILQIDSTIFQPIESYFGGYQNLGKNASGYQILLKYRFPKVAEQVTMSQVLNGEIKPNQVKDRIVVIGYTTETSKDLFYTPYSTSTPPETMPGVVVHAQMISQILSSVLDGRSQIWVWHLGIEFIWILAWTVTGASLFRFFRNSLKSLVLLESLAFGSLIISSYLFFTLLSAWVPLLPALVSSIAIIPILALYDYIESNNIKNNNLVGKGYKIETGMDGKQVILGQGGFKIVYKAKNLDLPSQPFCVIKKIKLNGILAPESNDINSPQSEDSLFQIALKSFKKEADILQKLEHNSIPRLESFFDKNREFYLVEDFIEGQTLDLLLTQWQSEDKVIDLLINILDILKYIHGKNVIHGDIKPSNLMSRSSDGKLFLIDFGAGTIFKSSNQTTIGRKSKSQTNRAIGTSPKQEDCQFYTPGYAPPEQQVYGKVCCNSDIYSLGIVAIEALTGIIDPRTLEQDDDNRLIWRHRVQVRENLASILDKMIEPIPVNRYQSADAVIDALQSIHKG